MAFIPENWRARAKAASGAWFWLAAALVFPVLAVMMGIRDASPAVKAKASAAADAGRRSEAYRAAVQFIQRRWPEAQKFDGPDQSLVRRDGEVFTVHLKVLGSNAPGGGTGKQLVVEESQLSNGWALNRITER